MDNELRDPKRIDDIVEFLCKVWVKVPDWRLTQLVINASETEHDCGPMFFMEDDDFGQRLQQLLESLDNVIRL